MTEQLGTVTYLRPMVKSIHYSLTGLIKVRITAFKPQMSHWIINMKYAHTSLFKFMTKLNIFIAISHVGFIKPDIHEHRLVY